MGYHKADLLAVQLFDGESFEHMAERFNRRVRGSRLLYDLKHKRHFLSKSERRRAKEAAAARRDRRGRR